MNIDWSKLLVSLIACQLAGFVGAIFTTSNIATWYATINKPTFTPPNWLFAPAWTTLFILMGIALYLIWEKGSWKKNIKPIAVFKVQLILNIVWSVLFFGIQNPFAAFIEIIFLWITILATIILFYKIDKRAAYLMIPYIAWVTFAALLNYSVWILNF
ncbi:MAG: tryptophan-rich sensory protein [Nanoarchaeota archaeon]|nr:tryptophan-rich sensory protein [Nanoarchaeota archaeon]MBU2519730.1 tryptophan-rich sensory protein [Nanoarchaeota archaeon]